MALCLEAGGKEAGWGAGHGRADGRMSPNRMREPIEAEALWNLPKALRQMQQQLIHSCALKHAPHARHACAQAAAAVKGIPTAKVKTRDVAGPRWFGRVGLN